jgi:hypothetical protein
MPVIVNVRDLGTLAVGDVVPGVKGVLKAVFKRTDGIGREKTGSVQTAFLKDCETEDEIKLKVWDREDVSNLKGSVVWLVSKQGKSGLTGLKIEEDTYNGKTDRVLTIKGSAEIAQHDGTAVPDKRVPREAVPTDDDVPFDFPAKPTPPPPPAPAPKAAPMAPTSAPWKEIGPRIRSIGAFQAAAMIEVMNHVIPAVAKKTGLTIEDFQAIQAMTATIMVRYEKMYGATMLPEPWAGYIEEETK